MGDIKRKYGVFERKTGNPVESFYSEEEAWEEIEFLEEDDKEEGVYIENRYDVVELYILGGREVPYDDYSYQLTGIRNERRFDWDED